MARQSGSNSDARTMTIREFAETIGVSKTTASKAFTGNGRIAPATRDAILRSAREMGFTLNPHAQRLANGHSKDLVGLFCPPETTGAALRKTARIQQLLDAQGLDVPLYSCGLLDGDGRRGQLVSIQRLCRQRPRAIVCSTVTLTDEAMEELRTYQEGGGGLVCFDAPVDLEADAVHFDRADNAYQVTRHLLELGHRAIGLSLVGNFRERLRFAVPRVEGFRRALAEFGVTERAEWLFGGGDTEEDGARLAEKFLALRDRPTGMYVANERVASAFINQVLRAGLQVPGDVSVVSHDNQPVAQYAVVPITTVTHPADEIAEQVATLLRHRLENPGAPPHTVVVRGELVVRESAAPLSA